MRSSKISSRYSLNCKYNSERSEIGRTVVLRQHRISLVVTAHRIHGEILELRKRSEGLDESRKRHVCLHETRIKRRPD